MIEILEVVNKRYPIALLFYLVDEQYLQQLWYHLARRVQCDPPLAQDAVRVVSGVIRQEVSRCVGRERQSHENKRSWPGRVKWKGAK